MYRCLCEGFTGINCETGEWTLVDLPCVKPARKQSDSLPLSGRLCSGFETQLRLGARNRTCFATYSKSGSQLRIRIKQKIASRTFIYLMASTELNECSSSPCQNGGTCTDQVNSFYCACAPGWTDPQCSTSKCILYLVFHLFPTQSTTEIT